MSWRLTRYIVVGVATFVIGLVAFLPARIAAGWIEAASTLSLGGVSGTLFNGTAGYVAGPAGAVENLQWSFHPLGLLLGRISAEVRIDSDLGGFSGLASHSLFGATRIDDLTGRASAGWLAKLGGYTFLPLGADIAVDIDRIGLDEAFEIQALNGQIVMANTRWELFDPPIELGRFTAKLGRNDKGAQLVITDSKGGLAIDGKARLAPDKRYRVDVRLRARAGADDRLDELLEQLGRADSQGWHRVRESGHL